MLRSIRQSSFQKDSFVLSQDPSIPPTPEFFLELGRIPYPGDKILHREPEKLSADVGLRPRVQLRLFDRRRRDASTDGWTVDQKQIKVPGRKSERDLRSEEHTSELQSHLNLVCRLLLEKKKHELIVTSL